VAWLRLGSLSVGSLTTSVLLGFVTGYLLTVRRKTPDTWYLAGYIGALLVLLLSYTARYSLFAPASLATGQISNLIVFGVVCLIQFAYHYGGDLWPLESRIALGVSLALALATWGSLFFEKDVPRLYDFRAQYFTYLFGPRVSIFILAGYLWSTVVLLRRTRAFSSLDGAGRGGDGPLRSLLRPTGRRARAARSFAVLTVATTFTAVMYFLYQVELVSRAVYTVLFNSSSLLICLLIFIVYSNNASRPTSFRTKLVGVPLAAIMVAFGIVASALMPVFDRTIAGWYASEVEVAVAVIAGGRRDFMPTHFSIIGSRSDSSAPLVYRAGEVSLRTASQALRAQGAAGVLPAVNGLEARFVYLDLMDPATFFLYYDVPFAEGLYRVVFPYSGYRLAIHSFSAQLAVVALVAALFVAFGFPLIFSRVLFRPLRALLEGVKQVGAGNYRFALREAVDDELGSLARGYNEMVASLRNAEGNFKALAENANDAILILTPGGAIAYANPRAAEISGYAESLLRDKPLADLVAAEDLPIVRERLSARLAGGDPPRCYETSITAADGRRVPVEATGARTVWHGQPADVVVLRDISERVRSEELLRQQQRQLLQADKLASIGALVAGVAHEVNNPNQVITTNARFLADGLPGLVQLALSSEEADDSVRLAGMQLPHFAEAVAGALQEIGASSQRIERIVGELKSFVRGDPLDHPEPTDVNEIVRSVATLSRHFISRATSRFLLDLDPGIPKVNGYRTRLEQVVLNLLQNACQALPDPSRGVTVRTRSCAEGITVEVSDEGRGIAAEALQRLGEAFHSTRRAAGGTGLGLYISKRIVREHHGTLEFVSELGRGTTATVRLPAVTDAGEAARAGDRSGRRQEGHG
jgi:PAS domain S-box-containing protein